MSTIAFDPEKAISRDLVERSRKELCSLVARICKEIKAQVGNSAFRGGIYPENISEDEEGNLAIGDARKSEWSENELAYVAPEIYWNNKPCPQSDVYALGLILFYGASVGRLPFEGESTNAQLMRMSGKTVYAPAAAGKRLGEIIEKALRFKESERYQNPEELGIMLDSCEDNKYIQAAAGAAAVFQKQNGELSELEKMMVQIMEGDEPMANGAGEMDDLRKEIVSGIVDSAKYSVPEEPATKTEDEVFMEAGLKRPEADPEAQCPEDLVSAVFGTPDDTDDPDAPDPRDPKELEQEEVIRVYEPGQQTIPVLTEDRNPDLAPVTVRKKSPVMAAQKKKPPVSAKKKKKKKRGRPLLVVLLLCAVLVIAAAVANILLRAFSGSTGTQQPTSVVIVTASPEPQEEQQLPETQEDPGVVSVEVAPVEIAEGTEEPAEEIQEPVVVEPVTPTATGVHTYEAVKADVSWTEAQKQANDTGGYLVTINNQEELIRVVQMAEDAGFDKIWIGCHRENGNLIWESGEAVDYYPWDNGEPSYSDGGDGVSEDYLLLWYRNGRWVYNDSRENPLKDYFDMYGGKIGYVIEHVG